MNAAQPTVARPAMKNETFGMYIFLLAEVMFFAALASVYTVSRLGAVVWITAGVTKLAVANLVLLLVSGVVLWLGTRAIRREDPVGLRVHIVLTMVLGAAFLGAQVFEFAKRSAEIPIDTIYGSVFYVFSGLHGVHVLGGLILLACILKRGLEGKYNRYSHTGVVLASLYWYFVVIVWVFLFLALYVY